MYIQQNIQEFFTKASELNFDIVALFNYNAVATTNFILFILVVVLGPYLLYRFVKTLHANRFIKKILLSNDVDEYDSNFINMIDEIKLNTNPYFIKEVYKNINKIEHKYDQFVQTVPVKDKIIYMQSLSQKLSELSCCQDKTPTKIKEFFTNRSIELIENDLKDLLVKYIQNCLFWENDLENIYAISHYVQALSKNNEIKQILIQRFTSTDLTTNYSMAKFITKLEKHKCENIYDVAYEQLEKTFHSTKYIYSVIIDCVYHSQFVQLVYDYISSLEDESYVRYLYKLYFDKKGDILLNLALISNDHIDNISHRSYLTSITTTSWSNKAILQKIVKNKHIINIVGHEETRKTMARIDELQFQENESENKKLALEAKELAQKALDRLNINDEVLSS